MKFVLALLVALVPAALAGAQDQAIEVKQGKTAGSGYEHLRFSGDPDDRGLMWSIQEPLRAGDYWGVSVLNTSDETVSGLCATIEFHVDGQWYLSGLSNDSMWPVPYELEPGEFSIALGETLGHAGSDWDDVRLAPCDADDALSGEVVDLGVRDFTFKPGEVSGSVINDGERSVGDITVYVRCVDDDGSIYQGTFVVLDLRKLDPGETEPFAYDGSDQCDRAADAIMSALAVVRGT